MTPSDRFYFEMIWIPRATKFKQAFQIVLFASFIVLSIAKMATDFSVKTAIALPLSIVFAAMLLFVISVVQQVVLAVANLFARIFDGWGYAVFEVILVFFVVPILFYLGTAGVFAYLLVRSLIA